MAFNAAGLCSRLFKVYQFVSTASLAKLEETPVTQNAVTETKKVDN
jgi:hypothetical protein